MRTEKKTSSVYMKRFVSKCDALKDSGVFEEVIMSTHDIHEKSLEKVTVQMDKFHYCRLGT